MSQTADVNSSSRHVAHRSRLRGSTAGKQTAEITEGTGCQLVPEGHVADEHYNVDDGKQGAQHSLVDNNGDGALSVNEREQIAEQSSEDKSSDGDSVKCPICSATFTTQEVATPDTCDHIFCAACLQELSQNENNCPVDKNMFNFIHVRHHLGGEIITRIPVGPAERKGECNHRHGEHLCCEYVLGHGWNPVFAFVYVLASLVISLYVLPAYSSR
jgi:hypothetical protein